VVDINPVPSLQVNFQIPSKRVLLPYTSPNPIHKPRFDYNQILKPAVERLDRRKLTGIQKKQPKCRNCSLEGCPGKQKFDL
jgi:hypothetical protein